MVRSSLGTVSVNLAELQPCLCLLKLAVAAILRTVYDYVCMYKRFIKKLKIKMIAFFDGDQK